MDMFLGCDCSMQPDEIRKLKEIIENLTSLKLDFAEIRKQMDDFVECALENGSKNEKIPKISELLQFQLGSAKYEYQQSLDDGVLSTKKDRNNEKQRIRNKFDRSMHYTKVSSSRTLELWVYSI